MPTPPDDAGVDPAETIFPDGKNEPSTDNIHRQLCLSGSG
jgi:hypothetical protein